MDEHGKGQARRAPLSGPGPVQGPDVTTPQRRPWKQPPSQPAGEVPAPDRPAPRAHPHEDHYSPALPEQRAEQHPPPGGVQHRQVGHGGGQGLPTLGSARVWDCGWGGAAADLPRDRGHGWGGHRALHPRALGSRGWGSESLVGQVATQAGRKERAVLAGRGARWGGAHGGAGRTARSCLRCRPAVAPGESEARGSIRGAHVVFQVRTRQVFVRISGGSEAPERYGTAVAFSDSAIHGREVERETERSKPRKELIRKKATPALRSRLGQS